LNVEPGNYFTQPPQPARRRPAGLRPHTPSWVTPVVGAGTLLCLVFGIGLLVSAGGYADSNARVGAVGWGVFALVAAGLGWLAMAGVMVRSAWGRPVAWAASVVMLLTCVGALAAIPAMIGLALSHNQSRP
jgi:hypothetical protein